MRESTFLPILYISPAHPDNLQLVAELRSEATALFALFADCVISDLYHRCSKDVTGPNTLHCMSMIAHFELDLSIITISDLESYQSQMQASLGPNARH